jgi:hypothetical protein
VTYNPDEKPYVQQRRHFRPSEIGEPLAITVYDFTDYGRTWIDNCADSLDYLRVKIREAYAHGELDATGYARVQERIDWVDAYLEMRNEINKDA